MLSLVPLLIPLLLCQEALPPQGSPLPVFDFPGHEERAALLTDYLRHHFESRKGIAPTLFNKEYLTIADVWMDGAQEPGGKRSVQELYAQYLLGAKIDEAGYVSTHQHFSHAHDYGYTSFGLEAIHYGLASDEHAVELLEWISGERIVAGDTSTGADIYRWRFGPRVSTRRNVEWYGQGWTAPESIPFGGQIQDGGAVLGFAYHDLMARLRVRGADDCWERLGALLDWEAEVRAAGGYRAYYEGGSRGTTLQGCGTAGGLGIDCEFLESSLVPAVVIHGFLGLEPRADHLRIRPRLPGACPEMTVSGLLYRGVRIDLKATAEELELFLHSKPSPPLRIELPEPVTLAEAGRHHIRLTPR